MLLGDGPAKTIPGGDFDLLRLPVPRLESEPAFRESVREFSTFVQSERQTVPAFRVVFGTFLSLTGIGIGFGLLYVLLRLAR